MLHCIHLSRAGVWCLQNELYCLRCHDKMGIPICGACHRPIEERVVTALGKNWHVEVSWPVRELGQWSGQENQRQSDRRIRDDIVHVLSMMAIILSRDSDSDSDLFGE